MKIKMKITLFCSLLIILLTSLTVSGQIIKNNTETYELSVEVYRECTTTDKAKVTATNINTEETYDLVCDELINGWYRYYANLPEGTYTLTASGVEGYKTETKENVDVGPNSDNYEVLFLEEQAKYKFNLIFNTLEILFEKLNIQFF